MSISLYPCCTTSLPQSLSSSRRWKLHGRSTVGRRCTQHTTPTAVYSNDNGRRSVPQVDMQPLPSPLSRADTSLSTTTIVTPATNTFSQLPRSYRVSLWDALAFAGPAPEIINGRLAMVGFLGIVVGEVESGHTALQLATQASPLTYLLLAVLVYASLVPMLKGAKSEAFGIFSPKAERLNGRLAMLGVAVLALLEYNSGVCFF